jgi:hypothetical protein
MLLQVAPGAERFLTVIAFERLFARVDLLVSSEVRYLRERLPTAFLWAGVRLKLVMHSLVLVKRRHLYESLLADLASELSVDLVSSLVLIEGLFGVKYLLTFVFLAIKEHICLNPEVNIINIILLF